MKWHQRFFWLLLLFLPTQLGLHFWPDWAGVLGRRVDYLAPTIYLTDILVLFTVGIYSISNIQYQISKKKFLFLIPIVLFVVLNVAVSTNHFVAIYKWLKVLEFIALGWYIVRTKTPLSFIITPLSIGVFYSSILAITQFVLQHSVGGTLWWLGERTFNADTPGIARIALNWSLGFGHWDFGLKLRPYATFPHPNVLGGFLAAVLPLIALRYLSILGNLRKNVKFFYGAVILAGIITLLLTFSRSAIVVGMIAMATAIARIRNKKSLILYSLFFILLVAGFMKTDFQEESVVVRQQLNIAAIKLWAGAPLFGVGLGNFLVRLPETLPTRTIYFLQPVHNIYLLLLSEVGIVGFLLFVWFLQKVFRRPLSIWHLAFGILLVLGLVDHYPLSLQQGQLLLAVLAGMSLTFVH